MGAERIASVATSAQALRQPEKTLLRLRGQIILGTSKTLEPKACNLTFFSMDPLRSHVLNALKGGLAYDTFDSIIAEFNPSERGFVPTGAQVSAWQILEHMRFCLRDILDFTENEDGHYLEPKWPDEYWSASPLPTPEAWDATIAAYKQDLHRMEELVSDPTRDFLKPFSWAPDYTLLREALLVSDHAAYHLGQLVELKRWIQAQA